LPDSPEVLAAHLRTIRWRSATAADRDLLQAPFRAGIRLDHYQLLPLRKALRLPRVNLLIADDVGLGKTVEAGLIVRELLLRRRIDFIVISPPPAMLVQWKDELESKFGLTFEIINRERIGELRRRRGLSVNPWTTGSRFLIAHSDLEPVIVRRLKADLRRLGEAFPERKVAPIPIDGLPADAAELDLWRRLAAYGELRNCRIARLPSHKAQAKISFVGLQQRL